MNLTRGRKIACTLAFVGLLCAYVRVGVRGGACVCWGAQNTVATVILRRTTHLFFALFLFWQKRVEGGVARGVRDDMCKEHVAGECVFVVWNGGGGGGRG